MLQISPPQLIASPGRQLAQQEERNWNELVERRKHGIPLAYLTGKREFFGLEFAVNSDVLIPRPETELLVETALEEIEPQGRILDLGTGCGNVAISIALARHDAHVTGVDISANALEVARRNLTLLVPSQTLRAPTPSSSPEEGEGEREAPLSTQWRGVGGEDRGGATGWGDVRFIESDWFSALKGETYDVIVSNPPYVADRDPHLQQGDVRFEPKLAFLGGADGLAAIREIVATAPRYLAKGGWLIFEHGYDQAHACRRLLEGNQFDDVFTANDLAGTPRVSGGRWR